MWNFLLIFWLAALHPVHVSVTDIVYVPEDRELEITLRIFTDDLEEAVRKFINEPGLDLLQPGRGRSADGLISAYVFKHFDILLDGRKQSLRFLGFESDADAVICYILAENVKRWRTMHITNRILFETFDDQSNLVHVTVQGKVRSLRLTRSQTGGSFALSDFR